MLVKAGEYTHLEAEVPYPLDCPGGQVGFHIVDIQGLNVNKRRFDVFNVKPDFAESADALSKWKRRHWLKQYPTIEIDGVFYPTHYEFYHCFITGDGEVERVFFSEKDEINAILNK